MIVYCLTTWNSIDMVNLNAFIAKLLLFNSHPKQDANWAKMSLSRIICFIIYFIYHLIKIWVSTGKDLLKYVEMRNNEEKHSIQCTTHTQNSWKNWLFNIYGPLCWKIFVLLQLMHRAPVKVTKMFFTIDKSVAIFNKLL